MRKYQLIQIGEKEYLLKVVSDKGSYSTDEYVRACKQFLGEKAEIDIDFVDNIPVEKTGKYKTIINRYYKKLHNIKTNK